MIIAKNEGSIRRVLDKWGPFSSQIAFVPTMGALHAGHIELIKAARSRAGLVVASIFVNPTQFNDRSDFAKYPKSIEQDINMLEAAGTDLLFLPDTGVIYPAGTGHLPHYPLGSLETVFEGAHRPGHFQGVCQVVHRLLEIVQPGQLFMGQKDYQQCMVVANLLEQTNLPVQLQIVPTIRETSGLAMSSRNRRLDVAQLKIATAIFETLQWMCDRAYDMPVHDLESAARERL
ncbi:MAG TPA: pantoate--beta-alanine ligase, partial [Phnomibacter sp.]|nr:pantoate--beta-alanine ligase [Phnomibacter sp.]